MGDTATLGVEEVIRHFGLEPLEGEGGWFRRTWAASTATAGQRPAGSAIYFLLEPGPWGFSAFHRLGTDEVYHFYLGDPVELCLIGQDGRLRTHVLGPDFRAGQEVQALAPSGFIQGSRLVPGGRWALLGTTMAPAYVPGDFELCSRAGLLAAYPGLRDLVLGLTRE